jgi:hypothetical protein
VVQKARRVRVKRTPQLVLKLNKASLQFLAEIGVHFSTLVYLMAPGQRTGTILAECRCMVYALPIVLTDRCPSSIMMSRPGSSGLGTISRLVLVLLCYKLLSRLEFHGEGRYPV